MSLPRCLHVAAAAEETRLHRENGFVDGMWLHKPREGTKKGEEFGFFG